MIITRSIQYFTDEDTGVEYCNCETVRYVMDKNTGEMSPVCETEIFAVKE